MNLLEITPADIERLKENKIVFGLLPERDREILRCVDTGNVERYCHSGFYRCKKGGSFDPCAVYRIIADYQPLSPSEEDIIAYLKASEVAPSQWPPVVQEWARKHDGELIWEFQAACGLASIWIKTKYISSSTEFESSHPHRLRADYGKEKNAGYVENELPINPNDIPYGPFTLIPEPERCVWRGTHVATVFRDPHKSTFYFHVSDIKDGCFCPYCGKRIEWLNDQDF